MTKNEIYAALPDRLVTWYLTHKRDLPWRGQTDPYRVWISEIMLQQTRVEAVRGYYTRFLAALPTVKALAEVPETELLKLWEGLGYYSRARNLQKAAVLLVNERDGVFPTTAEGLRALPGIGDYTAGAIASICYGEKIAAVDGNVLRVVSRVLGSEKPIDDAKNKAEMTAALTAVYPEGRCGDFTQSFMDLGSAVCTPKSPNCAACPLCDLCRAHRDGKETALPVKAPKKAKRLEKKTVFLLDCDGEIALRKRKSTGLLAGLWELPNVDGQLSPTEALAAVEAMGVRPRTILRELHREHIFTHIRWEMVCYRIECARGGDFVFASPDALSDTYALPTAFRQFLEE